MVDYKDPYIRPFVLSIKNIYEQMFIVQENSQSWNSMLETNITNIPQNLTDMETFCKIN